MLFSNRRNGNSANRKGRKFEFEICERRDLLAADLVVDITDGGASVEVGGEVSYEVSFRNRGRDAATGAMIAVEVPAGTSVNAEASSEGWTCEEGVCTLDVGDLEGGARGEANIVLAVSDEVPTDARSIDIHAEISSETREFWLRNNSDWSQTPIDRPYHDLRFDITDNGARVAPGETVSYAITYRNARDVAAPDSVITVELPEGTSFSTAGSTEGWVCDGQSCTLAVGEVAGEANGEATIAVAVSTGLENVRSLRIAGEIQSSAADINTRNNDDTSTTPIRQDTHDLEVDITDNGGKTSAGETVAYAVTYGNRGDSTAVGATISVAIPAETTLDVDASSEGWSCADGVCTLVVGDVESGTRAEATLALAYAVELPADVSSYRVDATIAAASGTDTSSRNNSDSSYTPLRSDTHDLALSITDNGASVNVGGTVTYAIDYLNRGDAVASGAVISVLLAEGTTLAAEGSTEGWDCADGVCQLNVGDVASGSSGEATIAVAVSDELADDVRYLRVAAKIEAASGTDKYIRNNDDPSFTPVDRDYHDLRMRITDNGARVAAGGTVTYQVTWENQGEFAAVGSFVTVELPEATAFSAEGSSEGWTCDGQICTLQVGDVAPDAQGEAEIAVVLAEELPAGLSQVRVDAVMAASEGFESSNRNNSDPSITPIDREYHDLDIDFTDRGAAVAPGGSVLYYTTYENRGEFAAAGAAISIELPETMTFDAAISSEGWSCEEGICTLSVGDLEPGASGEAVFGVTVADELPEGTNRVQVIASIASDSGADQRLSNNRNRSVTPIEVVIEDPTEEENEGDGEEVA